jgi:hypothetical protein
MVGQVAAPLFGAGFPAPVAEAGPGDVTGSGLLLLERGRSARSYLPGPTTTYRPLCGGQGRNGSYRHREPPIVSRPAGRPPTAFPRAVCRSGRRYGPRWWDIRSTSSLPAYPDSLETGPYLLIQVMKTLLEP